MQLLMQIVFLINLLIYQNHLNLTFLLLQTVRTYAMSSSKKSFMPVSTWVSDFSCTTICTNCVVQCNKIVNDIGKLHIYFIPRVNIFLFIIPVR